MIFSLFPSRKMFPMLAERFLEQCPPRWRLVHGISGRKKQFQGARGAGVGRTPSHPPAGDAEETFPDWTSDCVSVADYGRAVRWILVGKSWLPAMLGTLCCTWSSCDRRPWRGHTPVECRMQYSRCVHCARARGVSAWRCSLTTVARDSRWSWRRGFFHDISIL